MLLQFAILKQGKWQKKNVICECWSTVFDWMQLFFLNVLFWGQAHSIVGQATRFVLIISSNSPFLVFTESCLLLPTCHLISPVFLLIYPFISSYPTFSLSPSSFLSGMFLGLSSFIFPTLPSNRRHLSRHKEWRKTHPSLWIVWRGK